MIDIIEVRSRTTFFRTSVRTEQDARNAVFHLRRAEPDKRFTARRQDGSYVMPVR